MRRSRQIAVGNGLFSLKDTWHLAKPYWLSQEKYKAWALLSIVIVFNLLTVYVSVLFNKWSNDFFDALQRYDKNAFWHLIIKYIILIACSIFFQVLAYLFNKILEIRWRRWMTADFMQRWLTRHAYYKTQFIQKAMDNPDQRISQDIAGFISSFLSLSLGLLSNIVSLFSFLFILWNLSGALAFKFLGFSVYIPGYMVWVALIYAVVGTYITFKIGRPLIRLNFQQERLEADFRFGLMHVREYGENIAFYHGEMQEQQGLLKLFNLVVDNFVAIIWRQLKIDVFSIGYSLVANIFPLLVAAPRYFAKAIQLGGMMQIAGAFGNVQSALSFFVSMYSSLASWRAITDRLLGFEHTIIEAQQLSTISRQKTEQYYLQVNDLSIYLPQQQEALIKQLNFSLTCGERLLIKGPSGCGKTTLLRSIAGLWPYAKGMIAENPQKKELFIAQRPYVPNVSLREAICYPLQAELPSDTKLEQTLLSCGLAHLAKRLDEENAWSKVLSLGEQQRLAFAQIFINQPDIVYLDEATSALDEAMEMHLYQLLITQLPQSVIISIGHRSSLRQWHNQEIDFNQLKSA